MKGDLPIGVDRNSVDTWVYPNLFRMNTSTGAPPDYFDKNGQNWGFPTYNWEEMSKDNYAWWRARLTQVFPPFTYSFTHISFEKWKLWGKGGCASDYIQTHYFFIVFICQSFSLWSSKVLVRVFSLLSLQMSKYFTAYRIDHILGFFRIWELPEHAMTGLIGKFRPSIPLSQVCLILLSHECYSI